MSNTLEEHFKTQASKFVTEKDGKVVVDWQALHRFSIKCGLELDGVRSYEPVEHALLDYLLEINILTLNPRESWTLTDGYVDLSPSKGVPWSNFYFTREEDVKAYKDAFYSHLLLPARIKRASETV